LKYSVFALCLSLLSDGACLLELKGLLTYLLTYLLTDIQQLVYVLGALGRISRGVSLCPCSSPWGILKE